jgi:hypothetical protein
MKGKTILMVGVGFLLGSRAGNGPWQRVMELWNDLQGQAKGHTTNGQAKATKTQTKETASTES